MTIVNYVRSNRVAQQNLHVEYSSLLEYTNYYATEIWIDRYCIAWSIYSNYRRYRSVESVISTCNFDRVSFWVKKSYCVSDSRSHRLLGRDGRPILIKKIKLLIAVLQSPPCTFPHFIPPRFFRVSPCLSPSSQFAQAQSKPDLLRTLTGRSSS